MIVASLAATGASNSYDDYAIDGFSHKKPSGVSFLVQPSDGVTQLNYILQVAILDAVLSPAKFTGRAEAIRKLVHCWS